MWRHGDWITINDRGGCVITGRSDATLNRGGVRLGTAEFYSVVEGLDEVVDSVVVHLEDDEGGAGELLLFVVLAEGLELDDALRGGSPGSCGPRCRPGTSPTRSTRSGRCRAPCRRRSWRCRSRRSSPAPRSTRPRRPGALANPESLTAFADSRPAPRHDGRS